jgi:IS30 family transposase
MTISHERSNLLNSGRSKQPTGKSNRRWWPPSGRHYSHDHLKEEREFISRELAVGSSFRSIGRLLNRDHTVISREVNRNGGRSAYRVISAQRRADENRARPKPRLLEKNTALHDAVNSGLEQKWSPQQISKRLREDFPDDDTMRVSAETMRLIHARRNGLPSACRIGRRAEFREN